MTAVAEKLKEYLKGNQSIILATVGTNGAPDLRIIGGFGLTDFTIYIATSKESNKVRQIEQENRVALLFQHENEFVSKFYNVTIFGKALLVSTETEFIKARKLILNRKPHLHILRETHNIYKIIPDTIKTLDMGEKNPDKRISIFQL